MSEENDIQEETLAFKEGGISLQENRWGSYSNSPQETQAYMSLKQEIEDKMAKGEPVYVQILDERRKGAVGRLESINFDYRPAGSSSYSYYRNSEYLSINGISVIWDGRKNKCSPYANEIEYLPDWSEGTIWQWTKGEAKAREPRVVPYDFLGQEVESGQFVCFIHRRYGNISMRFGSVTRMTDKGTVFVKTLKLRDGERGEELKAFGHELVIVNDKLMSRLMLARLSAD